MLAFFAEAFFFIAPASAQIADCATVKNLEKRNSLLAVPKDAFQCQIRGEDPPTAWRYNDGKNSGTKVGGAGGFSYSAIKAPESPPKARNAKASVTKKTIESACSFPPKVKVGLPPAITLSGSCLSFMNGTFKAKDDEPPSTTPLPGITPNDTCPAESDTTGMYGIKSPILGGSVATPCGAMVPTSDSELVLNQNATNVAVIDNGNFQIRIYTKSGSGFTLTKNVPLPSYLCQWVSYGDTKILEKSMDLTPPIGQMITFSSTSGALAIRLQPRATMPAHYLPPYNQDDPELFLTLPVDAMGDVTVPTQASCPEQVIYAKPSGSTGARQDLRIEPARDPQCDNISIKPTAFNDVIVKSCRPNATLNKAQNQCFDTMTNAPSPAVTVENNWVAVCPNDPAYTGSRTMNAPKFPLATGRCPNCTCPQSAGIPPQTATCPNGSAPVNGVCADVPSAKLPPPELGNFTIDPSPCGAPNLNCHIVTIPTKTAACSANNVQQLQYGVLNRPNLHYPEGTGSKALLDKIPAAGASATTPAAMAHTVADTRFYTLPETVFSIDKTSPSIIVNEGGNIRLKNKNILIMNPSATINSAINSITLNGGGQLVSPGGTQIQSFPDGGTFTIGIAEYPITIQVSRSATLPAGFIIPTMPNSASKPAYIRTPAEPLPQ